MHEQLLVVWQVYSKYAHSWLMKALGGAVACKKFWSSLMGGVAGERGEVGIWLLIAQESQQLPSPYQ